MLEKTLESPLDCKEIQPVHSEGDQSWDFFGRTDAKAETPVLWPPHVKSWLIGKDSDAGRDWGQEEKGTTEDEMISPTQWTYVWVNSGSLWWTGRPGVLQSMQVAKSQTWLSNWTEYFWDSHSTAQLHYRISQVALVVKNPPANAGDIRDVGSIPGLGRSPGEGNGNPLQ